MTVHTRSIPAAAANLVATPFRVVVPRQLEIDDAMRIYKALREEPAFRLQDPFFLQNVSSIFPGVHFGEGPGMDLSPITAKIEAIMADTTDGATIYEDTFVELDVPEDLEDTAEALDVTDLTSH